MNYVKCLLYADFGKGKTVTASSFDTNQKIYYTDPNHSVLQKHGLHADLEAYEAVSQLRESDKTTHTTYILDTVSEMVEQYLDMLLEKASWGGRERAEFITREPELKGATAPALADYHVIRNRFRPMFRTFIQAPAHVFFISHENAPIEGMSKSMEKRPAMPDKTYKALAQGCNVVARMTRSSGKFFVDTEGNHLISAKSQIPGVEGKMLPNDFIRALQEWSNS